MKYTTLFLLALFVSFSSLAQPNRYETNHSSIDKLNREIYFQKTPLVQLEKSLGSPYFEEKFENGTVFDERSNCSVA